MKKRSCIIKPVSIVLLISFIFANPAGASLSDISWRDNWYDKLATNSGFERAAALANEEALAREAITAFLRALRARIERNTAIPQDERGQRLIAAAQVWAQAYERGGRALEQAAISRLMEECLNEVSGESMELLPAEADLAARVAEAGIVTQTAAPGAVPQVFIPFLNVSFSMPQTQRSAVLNIDGITYKDGATGRVENVSIATGIQITAEEEDDANMLIGLYNRRDELTEASPQAHLVSVLEEQYLSMAPAQLIGQLRTARGHAASSCLAALHIKGFTLYCGTRGEVTVPIVLQLGRGESAVSYEDITPLTDLVASTGLRSIIDSSIPVNVILDIQSEDGRIYAEYVVYEEGLASEVQRREITGPLLAPAQAYLQAKREFEEAQATFVRERDKSLKDGRHRDMKAAQARYREAKAAKFREMGPQLFQSELAGGQQFKVNFLEGYMADEATNVGRFYDLSLKLKSRFENFSKVYRDPTVKRETLILGKRLLDIAAREEEAFAEMERRVQLRGSRIMRAELAIYRERLAKLKDTGWALMHDVVIDGTTKVKALAVQLGMNPDTLSDFALAQLWSIVGILDQTIDQKIETRGRDSLGFFTSFTFANREEFMRFQAKLEDEGLLDEFDGRQHIPDLGNMSIVVRPTYRVSGRGEAEVDHEGPITVSFVYKTAELIGRLGDNTKRIKESMAKDRVLVTLLNSVNTTESVSSIKLAHSRWASAGIISEENCHPVYNVGIYEEEISGQRVEATWQVDSGRMYPAYAKMGHIFVVLNGDIDNYGSEELRGLRVYPDLTKEYERMFPQGRRISEKITTDTKLIPLRIEHYLGTPDESGQPRTLEEAIRLACADFAGSFAIQVFSDLEPDKIYCAVGGKGQSLYVGMGDQGFYPASEIHGFVSRTNRYVALKSGTVTTIPRNAPPVPESLQWVNFESGQKGNFTQDDVQVTELSSRDIFLDRKKYQHFLDKEISEAAQMWKDTIAARAYTTKTAEGERPTINLEDDELPPAILEDILSGKIKRIWIAGMGTAETAGYAIENIFKGYLDQIKRLGGPAIEIRCASSTDFSAEVTSRDDLSDTLVIGISQSGGTTDTNTFLEKASSQGARLLGIINKRDSHGADITQGAGGGVLYTGTGREIEIAVASTKAFYAQIAAGSLYAMRIAQALAERCKVDLNSELVADIQELNAMPAKMEAFLAEIRGNKKHPLYSIARNWPLRRENWKVVGWGATMPGAREVRIKLSEECNTGVSVDRVPDPKHIDFSAHAWTLVLLANARGADDFVLANTTGEIAKFLAHNMPLTIITHAGDKRFEGMKARLVDKDGNIVLADVEVITVPKTTEKFAPVLVALAGHKLAYETARAMDDLRANFLGSLLTTITKKRKETGDWLAGEMKGRMRDEEVPGAVAASLLRNQDFLTVVVDCLNRFRDAVEKEIFNTEFTPADAKKMSDYYYAFLTALVHRQDPTPTQWARFGFNVASDMEFLEQFEKHMNVWREKLIRSIDSIREQAKFLTVGTAATGISLKEAVDIVGECRDVFEYDEETAVLMGYDRYMRSDGAAQATAFSFTHPTTKDGFPAAQRNGRTSIVMVSPDRPGLLGKIGTLLGQRGINMVRNHSFTYQRQGDARPVFICRALVDADVDAVRQVLPHLENALNTPNGVSYRLAVEVQAELQSPGIGLSAQVAEEMARHTMRFQAGEIVGRRSFLNLLAEKEGVTHGTVTRRTLFHEGVHKFLDSYPRLSGGAKQALLDAVDTVVDEEFEVAFVDRFGSFENREEFLEEVIAQFYSEMFENRGSGLFGDMLDKNSIGSKIAGIMHTQLPELDNIAYVSPIDYADSTPEQLKTIQKDRLIRLANELRKWGDTLKINFERSDDEVEEEIARARMRMRPSGFATRVNPVLSNSSRIEPARRDTVRRNAQRVSKEIIAQLRSQGVQIDPADEDTIFIEKTVDISSFRSGKILRNTVITGRTWIGNGAVLQGEIHDSFISDGAVVIGASRVTNSMIGETATIIGSRVEHATVKKEAKIKDAIVETRNFDPADPERWEFDKNDMRFVVRGHPTVIGEGCIVNNHAYIQNTTVGEDTVISGGSYVNCEIGEANLLKNAKMALVHTEFDVIIDPTDSLGKKPSVAEMQERWIGFGYRYAAEQCYGEGLAVNTIATPEGCFQVALGSPEGRFVIYSSFDGTGETRGDDWIEGLDDPAFDKSAHKSFRLSPLAWVGGHSAVEHIKGGRINIVGMPATPPITDYTEPNIADVSPGAIVGPEAWINVWGPMLGKRNGQSWRQELSAYFLYDAPNLFARRLMEALNYDALNRGRIITSLEARRRLLRAEGVSEEDLAYLEYTPLERLVPAILKAKIARIHRLIEEGEAVGVTGVVIEDMQRALHIYQRHLASDLWAIRDGRLVHWNRNDATGEAELMDAERFVRQGLVEDPDNWPDSRTFYADYQDAVRLDPYDTQIVTGKFIADTTLGAKASGRIPAKFLALRNVYIHPSAIIDPTVEIEEGTPDNPTRIGAGVILRGNTFVRAGADLWRCEIVNGVVGERGRLSFVEAIGSAGKKVVFAPGASYDVARFEAKTRHVLIGTEVRDKEHRLDVKASKTSGDHVIVVDSDVGNGTTLFAYATLENSNIGMKNKIGCKFKGVKSGTGVTARHLASRVYNTDLPDGRTANASNLAAGSIVGSEGRGAKRVTLAPRTFVGSNRRIGEGCNIGQYSFIVDHVAPNTTVPMFTVYQAGRAKLGGVLERGRLDLAFAGRWFFGYAKRYAATPEQKEAVDTEPELLLTEFAAFLLGNIDGYVLQDEGGHLERLGQALRLALEFVRRDIGGELTLSLHERVEERSSRFGEARAAIGELKKLHSNQAAALDLLNRLERVCEILGQGALRMREGRLTDCVWHNRSKTPNSPNIEVLPFSRQNIHRALMHTSVNKAVLESEDQNVGTLRRTLADADGFLETKMPNEQIGLIVPASFIMDNIGTREALEELAIYRTQNGRPRFIVIVEAENDAERNVITSLRMPLVAEIVRVDAEQPRAQRMDQLVAALRARGINNPKNIGYIERPRDDAEEAVSELTAVTPDIYVGVPRAVGPGQLVSSHGIFNDVIGAITSRHENRVFLIQLPPIASPSHELQRAMELHREAVQFLKRA